MLAISCQCNRIPKRIYVMNPYAFPNLLNPTVPVDHRIAQTNPTGSRFGYGMSRVIFRLVCVVENILPGSRR